MIGENGKYRMLQACYWMLYCIGYGYVTYFLTQYNYTTSEIGVLTAVFGVLAAVIQTRLGSIADKSRRWNWRSIFLILGILCLAIVILMGIITQKIVIGILFGGFLICISSMMPLMNAACFYYQNRGVNIDFGQARGLGSLSYAAISFILGKLTVSYGALPVIITGAIDSLLLLLIVFGMKTDDERSAGSDHTQRATSRDSKSGSFLTRYPAFVMMICGLVLLLTFHNAINTYMLQLIQNVGGNSANMGTAIAIAAITELPVMFGFSKIVKRISPATLLFICGAAYIARGVLLLFAGSVIMIYLSQILQMLTFALYASASVYYTEEAMKEDDKVTGQALMSGVATVGAVIGNLLGGWTLQYLGISPMLTILIAITVAGTVIVGISCKQGIKAGA